MSPSLDVMPLTAASLSGASLNVVTLLGRLARPAEERLLPSGDRLLTLDGRWTDTLVDLYAAAGSIEPGKAVTLSVKRGKKDIELKVKPGAGF